MEELKDYLEESRARKERLEREEENPAHIRNRLRNVFHYMDLLNDACYDKTKLNTGIAAVDQVTGGLNWGDLVAINGDGGSGRTALALHYAIEVAEKTHKPVRIYSQAHSAHQITIRLLSMLTGIPISLIEEAKLDEEQWIQLATANNWLFHQDIHIYDMEMGVEQLLDFLESGDDFALVIIDGAPMCELETTTMQNMAIYAERMRCCVLFTCNYPSVAPYIAGYVSKVLNLKHLEENIYNFELSWTWHGQRGKSCLYWNQSCLRFMDNPFDSMENADACV